MSHTATLYPHLTVAEDGSVHIGVSRYKAIHLAAEHYQYGWTAEELLRQHPDLRPEQVYSVLTWFYDHFEDVVAEKKASVLEAESLRKPVSVSRVELLDRLTARKN